jgi:hypothetical protein
MPVAEADAFFRSLKPGASREVPRLKFKLEVAAGGR